MREKDSIFMSCPSVPHSSSPSSSHLSDFPSSFPVINYTSTSSHGDASIVTKSDLSSVSAHNSPSMAPQDLSSSPDLASSSLLPLNFSSQPEYFSLNSSLRSQGACSPQSLENHSTIPDYTHSTLTYSSKSQTECSPSLLFNGTSTFHAFSHSLSPENCSSTSQPATSCSSKSPLKCQPANSSMSCQTHTSISQITYSSLSLQNCKSESEHTQSECSSMPLMDGASTCRTIDYSLCTQDASITPTNEVPSGFSPISISNSYLLPGSSTWTLKDNKHAKTTQKYHNKSVSDDCSPVDIPPACSCEWPTDFPPGISSSHMNSYPQCTLFKNDDLMSYSVDWLSLNHSGAPYPNSHESPYSSQSQNYLDLSNITPINGIIPPKMNDTPNLCGKITTNHNRTTYDPITPLSSQSFQTPTFPESNMVSTNDELSVDHLPVDGHNSSSSSNSPAQDFTSPNSINQTVSTNTLEKHLCCAHASLSGATPNYVPFPEEENQVQDCEVCKASLENKVRMDQDRQLCELFLDSLSRFEDWLQIAQITTSQGNPYNTLHQEAKLVLRKYEVLLTEMREKLLDLETLNRQYWRLAQTPQQTLLPSILRSRMQEVNMLWDNLQGEAETLHRTLKSRVQQREEFETDQDDMKLCLTEMDLELSNVEYIYRGNSTEKIQQLKAFQEDIWSNMKKMEGLLERGDQLIDNSDPRDAADLEVEMTELGSYCQQIFIRLSRLQKRLVSTKLVFEDDFLDGAVEHLSSGSSDVFLDIDIEDEEVSSPVKVYYTNAALPVDLEWDPSGDVGRSSSHDGQESFYTATSAPWKLPQRSEGSRSSLSSYSGITSNMRRQEVKESSEDVHANYIPSQDYFHLEQSRELSHGQGQMKNTSVLHNSLLQLETSTGQDLNPCPDEPDSKHRMDNHFAFPGYSLKSPESPLTSHAKVIVSQSQANGSGQRRRQRKKKRAARNQDTKGTLKSSKRDVSILMENGDDLSHLDVQKTSSRPSSSLCLWIRRLAFASILLLVLVTSLLFPWGRQTCPSKRFSWSLMLTYVNGPPPT